LPQFCRLRFARCPAHASKDQLRSIAGVGDTRLERDRDALIGIVLADAGG